MSDSSFNIITEHCRHNGKGVQVRNHVLGIFNQKLLEAVENYKRNNDGNITPEIENALRETHLSETELKGFVAEAERALKAAEDELLRPYRGRSRFGEFVVAVLASVLGALLFALLLFALFTLAEEQMRPLVQKYFQQGKSYEQQVPANTSPGETPASSR